MTQTPRPNSVRAFGARRLTQATVAMVVVGVGSTGALVVHEASGVSASAGSSSSTSTSTSIGADSTTTDSGTTSTTDDSTQQLSNTDQAPQATSGGS